MTKIAFQLLELSVVNSAHFCFCYESFCEWL